MNKYDCPEQIKLLLVMYTENHMNTNFKQQYTSSAPSSSISTFTLKVFAPKRVMGVMLS